ncbi:MAG: hypothetical protein LBI06_06900 [Treponema sp.]|nr:hypothetical protein [Treponema sp.]
MEQVKDAQVMRLVERIGEHYKTNISNRFIRPALLQLQLDKSTWTNIEVLTEKSDQFRYQGYQFDEIYRQIAAMARFISATRREVAPSLRHRLSDGGASGSDRILRDMAVNTFSTNLKLFAELLNELYTRVVEIDVEQAKDKRPYYQQVPEFYNLGELILNG